MNSRFEHYDRINGELRRLPPDLAQDYITLRNRVAQLLRFQQLRYVPPIIMDNQYKLLELVMDRIDSEWRDTPDIEELLTR